MPLYMSLEGLTRWSEVWLGGTPSSLDDSGGSCRCWVGRPMSDNDNRELSGGVGYVVVQRVVVRVV